MVAVSSYNENYFIHEKFKTLPYNIIKEVKNICISIAVKTRGIFMLGFYENGVIFFETKGYEDKGYDEILAKFEINKLEREERELISSLSLWYRVNLYKYKDNNI